ncbi:MAG: hypothetical protein ACR2KK_21790 [Acidimicrobiales bacterium]
MTLDDRLRRTGDAIGELAGRRTPDPLLAPCARRRLVPPSRVLAPIAAGVVLVASLALWPDGDGSQTVHVANSTTTAPVATPDPVYQDAFTSRLSGWAEAVEAKGSIGYVDGQYRVTIDQANRGTFVPAPWTDVPPDVTVEVEATKTSDSLGSFGLACRDASGLRYSGLVDTNMTWRITRIDVLGENPRPLSSGTTNAVRAGQPNVLALRCAGGGGAPGAVTLTLWVNGQQVGEAFDADGLPKGRVGVEVASGAAPVSLTFDNFTGRDNS